MKLRPLLIIFLSFLLSLGPILPSLDPWQFFGVLSSRAATITWTGAGGNALWSNLANWREARLPDGGDVVVISAVSAEANQSPVIDQPVSIGGLELAADFSGALDNRAGHSITLGQGGLVQRGGSFINGRGAMNILGSLALFGGAFVAPDGALSVRGNWHAIGGTFEHNNGSVVLDGIEQVIFGSIVFHDLTKAAGVGQTLQLQSGKTITTLGALRLTGSAATPGGDISENILKIRATAPGSPIIFDPQGSVEASFLDLQDIINIRSATISCEPGCLDSGNLSGWKIDAAPAPTAVPDAVAGQARQLLNRVRAVRDSLPIPASPAVSRRRPPAAVPAQPASRRVNVPAPPAPREDLRLQELPAADFAAGAPVFFTITLDEPAAEEVTLTPATGKAPDLIAAPAPPQASPVPQPLSWLTVSVAQAQTPEIADSQFQPARVGDLTVIDAVLTDPSGQPAVSIIPAVYNDAGNLVVYVPKPTAGFRPGRYQLVVNLEKNQIPRQIVQNFTWGVLALNVGQSSYQPGDAVTIGMGVLDDGGHTICDADLQVDIVSPDGATRSLSTAAGDINFSPDCGHTTVTDNPDYSLSITASQPGVHTLTLTARTKNGERTISDGFLVSAGEPFLTVRSAATRIFPPAVYRMSVTLSANQDFSGQLVEFVPEEFVINNVTLTAPTATFATAAFIRAPDEDGRSALISPPLTLAKGEKATLVYTFDAPDISPRFYLLGDLTLINQLAIPAGAGGPADSMLTDPIIAESVLPSPSFTPAESPEPSVSLNSLTDLIPLSSSLAEPSLVPSGEVVNASPSPSLMPSVSPEPSQLAEPLANLKIENSVWSEPRSWQIAADATLYWVGTAGGSVGTASNWKTTNPTACGSGDAGAAPGASDLATFDADCDNNAVIDSAWSVAGLDLQSGYTGTLTQNASITLTVGSSTYNQAGGTFTGGNSDVDVNGGFTVSSGTFTATSGALFVSGAFTHSGGTFTHNSGTVVLDNTSAQNLSLSGVTTFNNLILNDGLVGYWKLDNDVTDSSGYANNGTASGAASSTTVPTLNFTTSHSYNFDGIDDYITVSDSASLSLTSTITISAWVRRGVSTANLWSRVISKPYTSYVGPYNDYALITNAGLSALNSFELTLNGTQYELLGTTAPSVGTWYHLAGTYDGSTTRIYVDGAQEGSASRSGSIADNNQTINIGRIGTDNNRFTGLIDDLRVYNRALSAQEIQALAVGNQPATSAATTTLEDTLDVAGNLTLNTGTLDTKSAESNAISVAGSWENSGGVFTPQSGTVTLDGTATGKELQSGGQNFNNLTVSGSGGGWTLQDRLEVDGAYSQSNGTVSTDSTANYACVAGDWDQTAGTFTTNSSTVTLNSSSAQTINTDDAIYNLQVEDPTENGLIGYWKLDEGQGTSTKDYSGTGATGTLTNTPFWSEALNSTTTYDNPHSLDLDGTNDYVDMGDNATLDRGDTADLTLAGWFNRDTFNTDHTIIAKRNGLTAGDAGYILYIDDATDQLIFEISDGVDEYSLTSATTFTATGWKHFVVIWDQDSAANSEIFINGADDNATDAGTIGNIGDLTNAVNFRLGSESDAANYFDGKIDDIRVYSTVPDSAMITSLAAGKYADGDNSTATFTQNTALDVNNNISIQTGILDVSASNCSSASCAITVGNNWNNYSGTSGFTSRTGTVTLDGTNQAINGSSSFYNLTKQEASNDASDAVLTIEASSTQTVTNTCNLDGLDANDELQLRSSTAGTKQTWDLTKAQTMNRLDVKDSQTSTQSSTCLNCTNAGGNDDGEAVPHWVFTTGPSTDQVLRHGNWWSGQAEQSIFW